MSLPATAIREAGAEDSERLSLVGRATFLETFAGVLDDDAIVEHCGGQHAPETYARLLTDGGARAWLVEATVGRAPVGYLLLGPANLPIADPQPTDLEIKRIYLLSRFQGGGVGRALIDRALAAGREAGKQRALLGVYAQNHSAIAFYRRQSFEPVGERSFRVGRKDYADTMMARRI